MSARDTFHELVRTALQNEGWTITHDPYHIDLGFVDFYIGLGAERLLAAMKDGEKIAVEIKTFLPPSTISEFHTAIGQFINYRIALEDDDPERSAEGSSEAIALSCSSIRYLQTLFQILIHSDGYSA